MISFTSAVGACAKMKKWEEAVALLVTAFSRPFGANVEINQGDSVYFVHCLQLKGFIFKTF